MTHATPRCKKTAPGVGRGLRDMSGSWVTAADGGCSPQALSAARRGKSQVGPFPRLARDPLPMRGARLTRKYH